jgi:hypothetical protein
LRFIFLRGGGRDEMDRIMEGEVKRERTFRAAFPRVTPNLSCLGSALWATRLFFVSGLIT